MSFATIFAFTRNFSLAENSFTLFMVIFVVVLSSIEGRFCKSESLLIKAVRFFKHLKVWSVYLAWIRGFLSLAPPSHPVGKYLGGWISSKAETQPLPGQAVGRPWRRPTSTSVSNRCRRPLRRGAQVSLCQTWERLIFVCSVLTLSPLRLQELRGPPQQVRSSLSGPADPGSADRTRGGQRLL